MITINLDKAKKAKLAEINRAYDADVSTLQLDPPKERESYNTQYVEAIHWRLDNTFPTPFIDGLLTERHRPNEDKAVLVQKIINAATALGGAGGPITGKRQRLEKAVAEAQTVEELNALVWE